MDTLWAPWRMEYILRERSDDCVFCEALKAGKPDKDFLVLHVGPLGAVVMNRYPYGHGHLLVMPRRHAAQLKDLTREENLELMELLQTTTVILEDAFQPQGFNLGLNLGRAGGAGIEEHLHWHVLPRWVGDVNFITLVGEVRAIPEHLAVTYATLRPLFAERFG